MLRDSRIRQLGPLQAVVYQELRFTEGATLAFYSEPRLLCGLECGEDLNSEITLFSSPKVQKPAVWNLEYPGKSPIRLIFHQLLPAGDQLRMIFHQQLYAGDNLRTIFHQYLRVQQQLRSIFRPYLLNSAKLRLIFRL